MNHTVVILAAGLGTRMRSKHAKVLHRAGGLALVEQVVAAARTLAPYGRIVVVTGHQAELVEELLQPLGIGFVRQQGQKGTGHALASCREAVPHDGLLTVLYGDTPLLTAATLERLRDTQANSDAAATLITTTLADPTGYGRILLNDKGDVTAIVEEKACTPEQRKIKLINSGIYCFRSELLWKHIGEIVPNPASGEVYLTDMAEILSRHGHSVRPMHVEDATELLGINTRVELATADRILRSRKNEELMLSGVTIERPETVTIDARVQVGTDTMIEPFARLLGATQHRRGLPHRRRSDSRKCRAGGRRAPVAPYTLIGDSRVDSAAQVGPFARLRMDAHVGHDARVGNFVELKKTHLGDGAKSQHLAYLGDSEIGERVNIGAGTITCNYDGEKKHRTTIGARAFVGSNSTLVAPVEIGEGSYIGAGSVITDAVPAEGAGAGPGAAGGEAGVGEEER